MHILFTYFLYIYYIFSFFSFFIFWVGSSAAHVAGMDPAGLVGSLAEASDPAGQQEAHAMSVCTVKA